MGLIVKYNSVEETLKRFIKVVGTALNTTRAAFSNFVSLKKYELQFDARTIYMSKYLNEQFDTVLERIYIINDATLEEVFLFRTSEIITADEETYIYRTAEVITADEETYVDKEIGLPTTDFIVAIPAALVALQTDPLFIASIKKYSFAGKIFEIITY